MNTRTPSHEKIGTAVTKLSCVQKKKLLMACIGSSGSWLTLLVGIVFCTPTVHAEPDYEGSPVTYNLFLGGGYPEGISFEAGTIIGHGIEEGTEGFALSGMVGTHGHMVNAGYGRQYMSFMPYLTVLGTMAYLYQPHVGHAIGPRLTTTVLMVGGSIGLFFRTEGDGYRKPFPHISFKLGF